jgi:hypothetical protein
MSDANDGTHPNLRPDSARVQRWREEIEHLRVQIMTLVMFRDDFAKFEKTVRGNARIMGAASPFPARVKQWYIDAQVMRIRRILEGKSERNDVHSLRLLLEDMRRACAAFTRGSIEELFDAEDAPAHDPEMRDFLVSSMWRNVGDVAKNEDRLYAKHIKGHLALLDESSRRIVNYADKIVAHDTVQGVAPEDVPKFTEIAECIGVIEEVAKHYIAALTGAGYGSLSPVAQYDEFDVFRFPWLLSPDDASGAA